MNEELLNQDISEYLSHSGVPGMSWYKHKFGKWQKQAQYAGGMDDPNAHSGKEALKKDPKEIKDNYVKSKEHLMSKFDKQEKAKEALKQAKKANRAFSEDKVLEEAKNNLSITNEEIKEAKKTYSEALSEYKKNKGAIKQYEKETLNVEKARNTYDEALNELTNSKNKNVSFKEIKNMRTVYMKQAEDVRKENFKIGAKYKNEVMHKKYNETGKSYKELKNRLNKCKYSESKFDELIREIDNKSGSYYYWDIIVSQNFKDSLKKFRSVDKKMNDNMYKVLNPIMRAKGSLSPTSFKTTMLDKLHDDVHYKCTHDNNRNFVDTGEVDTFKYDLTGVILNDLGYQDSPEGRRALYNVLEEIDED